MCSDVIDFIWKVRHITKIMNNVETHVLYLPYKCKYMHAAIDLTCLKQGEGYQRDTQIHKSKLNWQSDISEIHIMSMLCFAYINRKTKDPWFITQYYQYMYMYAHQKHTKSIGTGLLLLFFILKSQWHAWGLQNRPKRKQQKYSHLIESLIRPLAYKQTSCFIF